MTALRTRIKICGLTREQDVDAAVEAGVDAIGFVIYPPSPRFVTPERASALARRLPAFVTPVFLFVNPGLELVERATGFVGNATLQFHGDETPEQCDVLCGNGKYPFLKAARIPLGATSFDLVKFDSDYSHAQAILVDADVEGYGGGGKPFDWSLLPPSADSHLVLSGGLSPANVIDGILQVRPLVKSLAVDVSSGVEVSKGIKDAEKINRFVAAVRAADLLAKSNHVQLPAT